MPTQEWMVNTQAFVDHVFFLSPGGGLAKCSCRKCQNCSRQVKIHMERHLCKFDFMLNYERRYEHGKKDVSSSSRSQGKKNDGSTSSDKSSLFRSSSSHLSRRSALQRCLDKAQQVSHI
jgi:hypothetical protein